MEMTLKQFRSKGGKARAKNLSKERRRAIAKSGGLAKAAKRAALVELEGKPEALEEQQRGV